MENCSDVAVPKRSSASKKTEAGKELTEMLSACSVKTSTGAETEPDMESSAIFQANASGSWVVLEKKPVIPDTANCENQDCGKTVTMYFRLPCEHVFCKACIEHEVEMILAWTIDGEIFRLGCPYVHCGANFIFEDANIKQPEEYEKVDDDHYIIRGQ